MKNRTLTRLLLVNCLLLGLFSCSRRFDKPESVQDSQLAAGQTGLQNGGASQLSPKILVPAYFTGDSPLWDTLITNANLLPEGGIWAIINRVNGPWPGKDTALLRKITEFREAGGKILVYVNTFNYGDSARPKDSVKLEVDKWYDWYDDEIDGIFYDQVYPVDGSNAVFYQDLYQYAKLQDPEAVVMINPGANTSENYVTYNGNRVSDVICTYENIPDYITWWPFQAWQKNYTRDRLCFLVHTANVNDMFFSLNDAVTLGYGWYYCTDDVMANPWDLLPTYLNTLRKAVKALDNPPATSIVVDGNASDWNNVLPGAAGTGELTKLRISNNDSTLFILLEGTAINGAGNFFMDTDNIDSTGYHASAWRLPNGCNVRIENNVIYSYTGSGADWSWTSIYTLSNAQYYRSGTVIELSIPLSVLGMTKNSYIRAGFYQSTETLPRLSGALVYRKLKQ